MCILFSLAMYSRIHRYSRSSPSFISSFAFYILLGYFCLLNAYGSNHLRRYYWQVLPTYNSLSISNHPTKGGEFARRHVPENLRQLLAAESAANDGLAYPFLTLTLYLTLDSSRGVAITHWVLIGWLCMSSLYLAKHYF